ncbi:hypothetical protein PC129_g22557 [Phytophthora cactorum]|nr:hypothetical protein Pcac1_g14321 [Phytophthora cactorum]KAG2915662.1 hypothetical protein PC114_g7746 [Phytophthora cactorum]KAG2946335.1 hypothetical protein PC117_g7698 [Phytophthora cactorum]KAG3026237.1 hypothetical protein PC120_g6046 [Phytophthora cactorum]KAG3027440.1 hypothetical protein PC119_g7347 [Phytophthora cactorum]
MVGRSAQERQHSVHVDVTWTDSTGQPVDVRLVTSEPRDTEDAVEEPLSSITRKSSDLWKPSNSYEKETERRLHIQNHVTRTFTYAHVRR